MVSNKKADDSGRRPYTLRARARRQEDVHHRITLAAVHLHGTVGPARTRVSEIAKRAGVRRATVYNHFPTDLALIDACSSHWFSQNPPPDPATWATTTDPVHRAVAALMAMYGYYAQGQQMLENVLRDAPRVPALEEILHRKWEPLLGGIVETLVPGWRSAEERKEKPAPDSDDVELRASLRVALDFFTWQTLAASGLSTEKAAQLATAWIATASRFPL